MSDFKAVPYIYGEPWSPDLSEDNPLRHVNMKMLRAIETADNLNKIFVGHIDAYKFSIQTKPYGDDRVIIEVGDADPIPDIVPIYISEIFHHTKSSLDHIMYLLCKNPATGKKTETQFPIADTRHRFKSFGGTSRVKPEVKIILESIQPYRDRKKPEIQILQVIREINNWDKHNRPAIGLGAIDGESAAQIEATMPDGRIEVIDCDPLNSGFIQVKSGNEIAICPLPKGAMKVQPITREGVRYKPIFIEPLIDGVSGENVIDVSYRAIESVINMVIPKLKPFV